MDTEKALEQIASSLGLPALCRTAEHLKRLEALMHLALTPNNQETQHRMSDGQLDACSAKVQVNWAVGKTVHDCVRLVCTSRCPANDNQNTHV